MNRDDRQTPANDELHCRPQARALDDEQPAFGRWLGLINAGD